MKYINHQYTEHYDYEKAEDFPIDLYADSLEDKIYWVLNIGGCRLFLNREQVEKIIFVLQSTLEDYDKKTDKGGKGNEM